MTDGHPHVDSSDAPASYKKRGSVENGKATELKTAGREPRQEIARQQVSVTRYSPHGDISVPPENGRSLSSRQQIAAETANGPQTGSSRSGGLAHGN